MRKPSLEEVEWHFNDAKVVKCACDGEPEKYTGKNIDTITIENEIWCGENLCLWNSSEGYAEIIEYKTKAEMRKVIRLDEPKEEKQPKPIELTHIQTSEGWEEDNYNCDGVDKVVYLGKCSVDGDMFALYTGVSIEILKGHLNDGVY